MADVLPVAVAPRRALAGGLARFARNRLAVLGALVLLALLALALAAPLLYPAGAFALAGPPLQAPGLFAAGPLSLGRFPLGTDTLGRDVAAGIAEGARTSLAIGICATAGAVLLGTLVGAFAGYYRGPVDTVLMRVAEFFQTIPSFILAIVLVAILSPSACSEVLAIAAVSWPGIARLVRGEFAALGGREFVLAATGLGASDARIVLRHMLPNCASSLIAVGSVLVATSILFESGLAFLGLGDPNLMSWGVMISAGREVLRSAWWVCTFPGIAILLAVLSINLVGDGLNEALDPGLRDR